MPWRVVVVSFDGHPPPRGFRVDHDAAHTLGSARFVRSSIDDTIADVEWRGDRGRVDGGEWRMELDVPADGDVASFDVRVDGAGDPVSVIAQMCLVNGWAAFDTAAGAWIDLEDPKARGWEAHRAMQVRAIGRA